MDSVLICSCSLAGSEACLRCLLLKDQQSKLQQQESQIHK